jgi:hypothetical protein
MSPRSPRRLRTEQGSALIASILALLLLSVFALSVAVLADLESRLGLNQKASLQALALAEAGLEHGRNMLRDAATTVPPTFNAYIADATTRRLGVPSTGIPFGAGHYWVRVDNDCAAPAGFSGTPAFVPAVVEDDIDSPPTACSETLDRNETVVLTAWSEVRDGADRVIGRARLRGHYTIGNPWKHSCYDQDGGMCIDDAVGGCNNNPCIDPSDPRHPNGPAVGDLPIPSDLRCGLQSLGGQIPDSDVPTDVQARMTGTAPCFIYPYYAWAVKQPALNRVWCESITASGYGGNSTDECDGATPGTLAWDASNPTCTTTSQKCHGMVFFGPGNTTTTLATGADITVGGTGGVQAGCMGTRSGSADCPGSNTSVVVYVMGKITITNNVEINGTVVLHGNRVAGGGSNKDFGLTGTNRVATHPCTTPGVGTPLAGTASPYCGYPLAILAYNPNYSAPDLAPTTALGQSIQLDLSNSTTLISGLVYTGGTADFNPLTVDGGLIGWDVNITNTSSRITYNPIFGNAAPPPAFTTPTDGAGVLLFPATWVHCTYYVNDWTVSSPCS